MGFARAQMSYPKNDKQPLDIHRVVRLISRLQSTRCEAKFVDRILSDFVCVCYVSFFLCSSLFLIFSFPSRLYGPGAPSVMLHQHTLCAVFVGGWLTSLSKVFICANKHHMWCASLAIFITAGLCIFLKHILCRLAQKSVLDGKRYKAHFHFKSNLS